MERLLLLVEDDEDDVEIFLEACHQIDTGIQCRRAANGEEGLTALRNATEPFPDYIFLDLNMPRLNGKEFLRAVKEDPRLKAIPVIIFSTSSIDSDRRETERLGAAGFIVKPTSMNEMVDRIREAIG